MPFEPTARQLDWPKRRRCRRCGNTPGKRARYYPYFCNGCSRKYQHLEARQKRERKEFEVWRRSAAGIACCGALTDAGRAWQAEPQD